MSMRRGVVLAPIVAAFLLGGVGQAQEISVEAWEELRSLQKEIVEGRDAIVKANLSLTEAEAKAFWPVYNDYRAEMEKVNDRKVTLISDFAQNFGKLSDEKSNALLKESFAIQEAAIKVKEKYIKRFDKVLPPRMVTRFYQIDNKFDAVVNVRLAENIPLAP